MPLKNARITKMGVKWRMEDGGRLDNLFEIKKDTQLDYTRA